MIAIVRRYRVLSTLHSVQIENVTLHSVQIENVTTVTPTTPGTTTSSGMSLHSILMSNSNISSPSPSTSFPVVSASQNHIPQAIPATGQTTARTAQSVTSNQTNAVNHDQVMCLLLLGETCVYIDTGIYLVGITRPGASVFRQQNCRYLVFQVLTKTRLQDLVKEIDPCEQLDEEVEDLLLQLVDDFVNSTVNTACVFAKHRNASTVEVKDVQLYLGLRFISTVDNDRVLLL